jgi:DNA-binding GntR family transcriptional regulator
MQNLDAIQLPDGMPPVRFQRALPAGMQVYAALRHAIVTLRLRPGQSLSEQGVAQQLHTSRTPVREAFIKLAEAGLFEVLPQRGTFVRKISLAAVETRDSCARPLSLRCCGRRWVISTPTSSPRHAA